MFKPFDRRADALKTKLLMTRTDSCPASPTSRPDSARLRRCRANWVPAWVDDEHRIEGNDPAVHARRAITDCGRLIWMVHRAGRRFAYHSLATDPIDAILEAEAAVARRRAIRARWDEVDGLRRDALARRVRFTAVRSDAAAGGLCQLGIEGYMRALGLARVEEVSAFWLAVGCKIDEQAGFALFSAAERHGLLECTEVRPGNTPDAVA